MARWRPCGPAAASGTKAPGGRGGADTAIDTEAGWTKSGWHGVYGWKLHLAVTAAFWIPLAAELTPANVADNGLAPALLPELPPRCASVADVAYDDRALRAAAPRPA